MRNNLWSVIIFSLFITAIISMICITKTDDVKAANLSQAAFSPAATTSIPTATPTQVPMEVATPTVIPTATPQPTIEPDVITDIPVKLYNNHKEGFNPIDGEEYIKDIATLLTKYAPEGLRIGCGCAMAYTEGGAGKQGIYPQTNNCFGIRANPGWNGWVFSRSTQTVYKDYKTAVNYGATDFFRAYPSMEDSVKDYVFHMSNELYNKALTMDNDADYLYHIVNQGYGPKHLANDWLWLIDYYNLNQYNITPERNRGSF